MEVRAYKPMTTTDLVNALSRYIQDNARSSLVEERWLAAIAIQSAHNIACQVGNSRLSPESRTSANAFRAAELELEIERKRKDMEALERDLKKVRAA